MAKKSGKSMSKSAKAAAKRVREDRRTNTINLVLVAAFVLALVIGFGFIRGVYLPWINVLSVDDYDMDAVTFNYFYRDTYDSFQSAYGEMLEAYGTIDPNIPLNEQAYAKDYSWADFFYDTAVMNAQRTAILWKEARAAGYELSETGAAAVTEEMEAVRAGAKRNGFVSPGAFVRAHYGKGASLRSYEEYMALQELANEYSTGYTATLEYGEEELRAWYEENYPDAAGEHDYNTVNFRLIYLPYSGYAYDEEMGYYGYSEETKTRAMTQLKSVTADYMALPAEERTEDDFAALATEFSSYLSKEGGLYENTYKGDSGVETQVQNWLFKAGHTAGDVEYLAADSGAYLLYWIREDIPVWEHLAYEGLRNDSWNEWYAALAKRAVIETDPDILRYLNLNP